MTDIDEFEKELREGPVVGLSEEDRAELLRAFDMTKKLRAKLDDLSAKGTLGKKPSVKPQ